MAPRAVWKGYLKVALVSCAVEVSPAASERDKVRFHLLNKRTGHRLRSRYVDSRTGRPVPDADQVKGYPVAEDHHVVLEDEELEAVALESTRTIDVDTFVPRDSIGWLWPDQPHHVVPDGEPGQEAFAVIREAMRRAGAVGVARVVLHRRERAVMVEPCGKGLVAWTLRFGDEVRASAPRVGDAGEAPPDPRALRLVRKLIAARTRPWDPDMVRDPVQEKLLEIIAGKKPARRTPPAAGDVADVVSIMDALARSVAEATGRPARPARNASPA